MLFGASGSKGGSTPQKTLELFIAAINRRDNRAMEALVQGSKYIPALEQYVTEDPKTRTLLFVRNISVKPLSASRVTLRYVLYETATIRKARKPAWETLDMVKVSDGWRIVAPKPGPTPPPGQLQMVAMILADPATMRRFGLKTKMDKAQLNLKVICTSTLMYLQDSDETFLLTPEDYVKRLTPYIKRFSLGMEVLTSPLDTPSTLSFAFNGSLTGQPQFRLEKPENTVMFFEGKSEALSFRYADKAIIGFADGSVRFVTPAQAKTLLWK